jgi:hypothetical protein
MDDNTKLIVGVGLVVGFAGLAGYAFAPKKYKVLGACLGAAAPIAYALVMGRVHHATGLIIPTADAAIPLGFDRAAANTQLDAVESTVKQCFVQGVGGQGSIIFTFDPVTGRANTHVNGPIVGTSVEQCIVSVAANVAVPPFAGQSVIMTRGYSF